MRRRWLRRFPNLRALVFAAWGASLLASKTCPAASETQLPGHFGIRWVSEFSSERKSAVEVTGLSAKQVAGLRRTSQTTQQWQRMLSVHAEQGDLLSDIGLPPMLGAYSVVSNSLRFEPQFPFVSGVRYHAAFHPDQLPGVGRQDLLPLSSEFQLPAKRSTPTTTVTRVYPTSNVLPENLLKFYVYFSAPMSGGHIYDHIHLRNEAGRNVELPFLEIDEELWDPGMTRLTLFIDPGRIKREVRPLEEIGPALEEGKRYSLIIDKGWRDADGLPMKEAFAKAFKVGPPDREAMDISRWKVTAPPGDRSPLVVTFQKPLDHALARRLIRVHRRSGEMLAGKVTLEDNERRWIFVPDEMWTPGLHDLVVQTTIEDLAGNNIGKSFEVDLFEGVQRRITNSVVKLPFEIPER